MTIETWFPSVIFYHDLDLEPSIKEQAIAAVRESSEELLATGVGATAVNADNALHLDPRISALFGLLAAPLKEFLFNDLGIDLQRAAFYVGRCWPVVQSDANFAGGAHRHDGAVFSGVFYLQVPEGAGPLLFTKPHRSSYDNLGKAEDNALNYVNAEYAAVENRLILFSSDLEHQRLSDAPTPISTSTAASTPPIRRTAIAFDIYSMVDIDMKGGGMPHYEQLRRII